MCDKCRISYVWFRAIIASLAEVMDAVLEEFEEIVEDYDKVDDQIYQEIEYAENTDWETVDV